MRFSLCRYRRARINYEDGEGEGGDLDENVPDATLGEALLLLPHRVDVFLERSSLDEIHDDVEFVVLDEDPTIADDVRMAELLLDDAHLADDVAEALLRALALRLHHVDLQDPFFLFFTLTSLRAKYCTGALSVSP